MIEPLDNPCGTREPARQYAAINRIPGCIMARPRTTPPRQRPMQDPKLKYTGEAGMTARDLIVLGLNNHAGGTPAMHRDRLGLHRDSDTAPADALVRWAQNYFRHHCTNYEQILEHITATRGVCNLCEDDELLWAEDALLEEGIEHPTSKQIDEWTDAWFADHACVSMDRRAPSDDREALHVQIDAMMDAMGLSECDLELAAEDIVREREGSWATVER